MPSLTVSRAEAGLRSGTFPGTSLEPFPCCIRIGWVWRGENLPSELPPERGDWFRNMWLSDRDFLHLLDCCLTAELLEPFLIVNGMSNNTGMRWDLTSTTQAIGYQPQDDVGRKSC